MWDFVLSSEFQTRYKEGEKGEVEVSKFDSSEKTDVSNHDH